jgi:predicted ATPase
VIGLGPLRRRLRRAAARGLTKFVGREREMEALKYALEHAKTGHGQIVAVVAEPGVGKSRLFYEFKATSQSGCMVLEAYSVSHCKASAYLPVIELLKNYFEITSEDDGRKRREKVGDKVLMLDRMLEDALPHLFTLLGIADTPDPLVQMDGQVKKRRTLEVIKRMLLRESLNQPLMLIFEDLHWIDGETEALLNLLAEGIANAHVLLLVNYRAEYHHEWENRTYYNQLRPDPLPEQNADEMLSALLGEEPELGPLKRTIIARTEGNPFFIEELVQALFDEGALVRNGAVKVARSLAQLRIPAQAVLAARIDRLPSEHKELLQTLAVIGREFPLELIRKVSQLFDAVLDSMLRELQLAEFIYEQPALAEVEYTFKHALMQEVAYSSVLTERRKLFHERTAAAIESLYAERLDDHVTELAHHYSRSRNTLKALEYIGLAGEQAVRRSAYSEAIALFRSGLGLLESLQNDDERRRHELALQVALGPTLIATEGFADGQAEIAYTRALELCRIIGDGLQLFRLLRGLWVFHLVRGEYATARELAEQLLRLAERQPDQALFVEAHYVVGITIFYLGELGQARAHLEKSISLYDPSQQRSHTVLFGYDPKVASLSDLGWALWILGYPDSGVEKAREGLFVARELGHPYNIAMAMIWLSWVLQCRREGQAGQEFADAAAELSTDQGFASWIAMATVMRGGAMVEREEPQEGIDWLRRGLAAYRATRTEA